MCMSSGRWGYCFSASSWPRQARYRPIFHRRLRRLALWAQDNSHARPFATRGSRLAFSNGILLVAIVSGLLVVAFQGSLTGLAPLFTVGAFLAFTLSQAGMVRYWWRHRSETGW